MRLKLSKTLTALYGKSTIITHLDLYLYVVVVVHCSNLNMNCRSIKITE